jgi:hypothetical protein
MTPGNSVMCFMKESRQYDCVRPFLVVALMGLVFALAIGFLKAEPPDNDLAQRFLNDGPRAWAEYRAVAERFQGGQTLVTTTADGKPGMQRQYETKKNENCKMLLARNQLKGKTEETVYAVNSRYSFALRKNDNGQAWVMTTLKMRGDGRERSVDEELSDVETNCILIYPSYYDLAELVKQPTFRVLRATVVPRDGEQWAQIDFDNTNSAAGVPKSSLIQGGTLLLDPKRYWCVRSAQLRVGSQRRNSIETEIRDLSAKYPVPKKYLENREIGLGQGSPQKEQWIREFDLSDPSSLPPDSEFTLSAFGLKEPPGIDEKGPIPLFLWIVGGAVVLLVVGTLISWLKRRLFVSAK